MKKTFLALLCALLVLCVSASFAESVTAGAEAAVAAGDYDQAVSLLKEAVAQDNDEAYQLLAKVLFTDQVKITAPEQLIAYFEEAAEQGSIYAHHVLGRFFQGKYDEAFTDLEKAARHYEYAAERGLKYAQNNLGVLYHDDQYGMRDDDKAEHYYLWPRSRASPPRSITSAISTRITADRRRRRSCILKRLR